VRAAHAAAAGWLARRASSATWRRESASAASLDAAATSNASGPVRSSRHRSQRDDRSVAAHAGQERVSGSRASATSTHGSLMTDILANL
jgi:hypothetical protein